MDDSTENSTAATDMETLDYLRGVKSSTCLLLSTTPSPTPHDFKHPLSEEMSDQPFLDLNTDPNAINEQADVSAGDSSSSGDSSSVVQDPVSAQLINNISMLDYQTLSKNGDLIIGQAEDGKLNGNLKIKNRKLPGFVNWNWGIIRKVLLWIVLSGLIACLGAIIAMVVTIPKDCNPDLPWFQGKVFYEVFPASFKDSSSDGIGDLKGLVKKLDYIQDLGVSAIRLNYIFETDNYPENYNNVTSLRKIDKRLGVLKDLQDLIVEVHNRNMSLILDLPVYSMVTISSMINNNLTQTVIIPNVTEDKYTDETSLAIKYWTQKHNVDGFYLKRLENFVDHVNFGRSLQIWKQIIGNGKILIASENAYKKATGDALNVLLSRIDLVDIYLDLHAGTHALKDRIEKVISGPLWSKSYFPWVHWNIGNVNSERISTKYENNTMALTVLEFVLPGTVNLFYGDEVGLSGLPKNQIEEDFHEHKDVSNLVLMPYFNDEKNANYLSWISKSDSEPRYDYLDIVKNLIKIRLNTPTIYLKGSYKEGNLLKNMEIRKTEDNLVVIERWYPRRNTCVYVGNLGNKSITTDLSSMFYGGTVVAGTNTSLIGQVIYFDNVSFPPNSAILLKLEK